MHDVSQFVAGKCQSGILHLLRFSAGLPLLIPTDRAAPSYQVLVLSLASLAFVLFVAITDILTFGARTEVRSFLDIRGPRTIPAFGDLCWLSKQVRRSCQREPPVGGRFDSWPATARFCGRCHTDSTRERTQADAAAIRSS